MMSGTSLTGICYPPTRRSDTVNVYKSEACGEIKVPDPYQWLEEDTEERRVWTTSQEALCKEYLEQYRDRQLLEDDIRSNTDYAKFSSPSLEADGYWYWSFNSGLQAQSVIYRSNKASPDFYKEDNAEIFFDTNLLSTDGTLALQDKTCVFSQDAKYWAYGVYPCGSDFCTIYVRPTSAPFSLKDGRRPNHLDGCLPDELRFVKFTDIVWTPDSKGFFYKRYPDRALLTEIDTGPDLTPMICYHRLGTPQSEDILVITDDIHSFRSWFIQLEGDYLIVSTFKDMSFKNLLWVTDLSKSTIGSNMVWDKIVDEIRAKYEVIIIERHVLYIRTDMNASNYKVITIDMDVPTREPQDFILEDPGAVLKEIKAVNSNKFAVIYQRDVNDEIYIFNFAGDRLVRLASDFVGAATLSGKHFQSWLFVTMTGFTCPGIIAQYNFATEEESKRWMILRTMKVKGLVPSDFETQQLWYPSRDGTRIPMFVVRHKSTKFDGTAPAIQYGYGGNGVSTGPWFSPSFITFLKRYGGVLGVVNIRGGGEFGEDWHRAAIKENKAKSFDDFIDATRFLIDKEYVAPGKVALNGWSNGALVVAACANRATPGLIGAALPEGGPHDLLKFPNYTIGRIWVSDYGNPRDPHDFDFIYPISPLHNVPLDRALPPTLILTADNDDRVVPMHSLKYAATLQHAQLHNPQPFLLHITEKAGHSFGKITEIQMAGHPFGRTTEMTSHSFLRATETTIQLETTKLGFLAQSLGLVWKGDGMNVCSH